MKFLIYFILALATEACWADSGESVQVALRVFNSEVQREMNFASKHVNPTIVGATGDTQLDKALQNISDLDQLQQAQVNNELNSCAQAVNFAASRGKKSFQTSARTPASYQVCEELCGAPEDKIGVLCNKVGQTFE